jgi:hypothetical protein
MKNKIHHIGIVVDNFDKYVKIFMDAGGKLLGKGIAKEFDAECVFIDFGNIIIELVKGIDKDKCNLNKKGVRLHHIAFYGKGTKNGAFPNMLVDFKLKDKLLFEWVTLK